MNLIKEAKFETDKANPIIIKKSEKSQQLAVALGKGAVLKKHKTSVPATLFVVKGEITFNMENKDQILNEGDVFEIPVDIVHEVIGNQDENLFVVIKEL